MNGINNKPPNIKNRVALYLAASSVPWNCWNIPSQRVLERTKGTLIEGFVRAPGAFVCDQQPCNMEMKASSFLEEFHSDS